MPPVCLKTQDIDLMFLVVSTTLSLFFVVMVIIIFAVIYRRRSKTKKKINEPFLLFRREEVVPLSPRKRKFDAFVLYHFDRDDDFVMNHLVLELEESRDFKLCIHSRNFTPGRNINDNIEEAIDGSNSASLSCPRGLWTVCGARRSSHTVT